MKIPLNVFGVSLSIASSTIAVALASEVPKDSISQIPGGQAATYGIVGLIAVSSVGSQIAAARDMAKRLREIENQRFAMLKEVVDACNKFATSNVKLADQVEKLIEQLRSRPCQVSHKNERLNDES